MIMILINSKKVSRASHVYCFGHIVYHKYELFLCNELFECPCWRYKAKRAFRFNSFGLFI